MNKLFLSFVLVFGLTTYSFGALLKRYVNAASDSGDGTTVALTGANAAYSSLSVGVIAEAADLQGGENIVEFNCFGTEKDTTTVDIDGYSCGSAGWVHIIGEVETGVVDTDLYTLDPEANGNAIINREPYTIIEKLQITGFVNIIYQSAYGISSGFNIASVTIRNNIIYTNDYASSPDMRPQGINIGDGKGFRVYNNIIYDMQGGRTKGISASSARGLQFIYNNTVYGVVADGIVADDADIVVMNNIVYNCGTDFSGTPHSSSDYNFSKDDTAFEASGNSIWGDTDGLTPDFVSITGGSEDFHLESTSDAIGEGVELSAEYSPDMEGDERVAPWDMGADFYVAEATGWTPSPRLFFPTSEFLTIYGNVEFRRDY